MVAKELVGSRGNGDRDICRGQMDKLGNLPGTASSSRVSRCSELMASD